MPAEKAKSESPSSIATTSTLSAASSRSHAPSDIQPPLSESDSAIRLSSTGRQEEERVWEAPDYTVSKVVEQEGNRHVDLPRFGATCTLQISAVSVVSSSPEGLLTLEALTTDFFYSKYFNVNHSGEVQVGYFFGN